jgi:hypothetical protein
MALMEDERLVLRWLSQYGPLRLPQIWGLLHYKPQRSVNRLVQNMKRTRHRRWCVSGSRSILRTKAANDYRRLGIAPIHRAD